MLGVFNSGFQSFVQHVFGHDLWEKIKQDLPVPDAGFETMLNYPDELTQGMISKACDLTGRSAEDLLEDFGTYLISSEGPRSIRTLLVVGASDYQAFIDRLPDLAQRMKLALRTNTLPSIGVEQLTPERTRITCTGLSMPLRFVFLGILRALADHFAELATVTALENNTCFDVERHLLDRKLAGL